MALFDTMRRPYSTVIKGEWKNLHHELNGETNIVFPMTTGNDTAVHLAVYSGEEEPTKTLLAAISNINEVFWKNSAGQTPLHEAAAVGNLATVKLLVEFNREDLLVENIYGETPLFRAARFGHLHIVKYFLEDSEDSFSRSPINWTNGNGFPIIHAAIESRKFEVVQRLVEFDKSLLEMKDREGKTALHLLANMPFVFKSGSSMNFFELNIYPLLPGKDIYKYNSSNFGSSNKDDSEGSSATKDKKSEDLEAQSSPNRRLNFYHSHYWKYFVHFLTCYFWRFIFRGWPQGKKIYQKKQDHKLAVTITEMLAQIDYSWRTTEQTPENTKVDSTGVKHTAAKLQFRGEDVNVHIIQKPDDKKSSKTTDVEYDDHHETPILLAAANGIIEIVKKIVEAHPQAVDYVTRQERNILHVAIAHRQSEIFEWIKNQKFIMTRLVTRIDAIGFTALHHAGVPKFYRGGSQGPALELQQELKWFQLVRSLIPALYVMHHSNKLGMAQEYFDTTHKQMLDDGKEWFKKTSESCSAVAVLIATVVFAAAYTVPGGLNEKTGSPVLLTEPIYMVFTVMDIVGLATSLTSVVLFLSILTSPFKMDDFLHTLPLKLWAGFLLLFISVASTMMAFALTIVLTIRSTELKWTVVLLYVASFCPVTIFLIIHLPLFVELIKNNWSYPKKLFKFLRGLVVLFWKLPSKLFIRKSA